MSKLKFLIAVRHCLDCSEDELSPDGLTQAEVLANRIRNILDGGNKSIVLSSPPGRAKTTANIIAKHISTSVVIVDELELDYHHHGKRQVEAIEEFFVAHDNVVVVTHFEAPSGIMHALSEKFFSKRYPAKETKKGTGFIFYAQTGAIEIVP